MSAAGSIPFFFLSTYVHVEVGIVNIEAKYRLPEVDMTNTVRSNVAVIDPELDIGNLGLHERGGSSDIVITLDQLRVRTGVGLSRVDVASSSARAKLVKINQSLGQRWLPRLLVRALHSGMRKGRTAQQAEENE